MASWLHRTVLAGLLLTAYLYAWTPLRTAWIEHGATPLLNAATGPHVTVSARPKAHVLALRSATGSAASYTAPAGVKFLLPGLFLLVIAPSRPRLGLFFAGHLALGGLALGLLAAGGAGFPGGFPLADFVQSYGVDTFGLAVPVLVFAMQQSSDS